MNPTENIAAEAARNFLRRAKVDQTEESLTQDIKSACEKATEPLLAILQDVYDEHMHFGWGYEELHDKIIETLGDKLKPQNEILESDLNPHAAHANEDNCRKCGRPLGWFEPGLCDNCRAVHAGKPKPLERCSSNPHYEAHFGDNPARASEQEWPDVIGCGGKSPSETLKP